MTTIEKYSLALANSLSEQKLYDINEITRIIGSYIRMAHKDLLEQTMIDYDKEYKELLSEQNKYKVGHPKYVEIGIKIALNKPKRAAAHSALNNVKRTDLAAELQVDISRLNKERDVFSSLLKEHAPEVYKEVIDSFRKKEVADFISA